MYQERIRCNPSWRDEYARYDTVFVPIGPDVGSLKGMVIGRVRLFFSFTSGRTRYPCALVEWFVPKDTEIDENTGMWVVMPEFERGISRRRALVIICEELTTYETREVVAVPNSRSMGGV
jgi:hypothetical protein